MNVIEITDTWQARCNDGLNWQVWQYRDVETKEHKIEKRWVGLNSYHGTVDAAVKWVWKADPKLKRSSKKNLKEFIEQQEKLDQDIKKHADKFAKTMEEGKCRTQASSSKKSSR